MHHDKFTKPRANGLGAKSGNPQIGGGEDDHKFFASVAADEIFGTDAANQKRRGFAQHRVTGFVAVSIVELLKVIQIEHHDAERLLSTGGATDFAFQHFGEIAAVVKAG